MLPTVIPQFLSASELAYTLLLLSSVAWYPCPMQESQWPMKQCTKLNVTHLSSALAKFRKPSPFVAVTMDLPSPSKQMRHRPHYDVFPERKKSAIPPSATHLVYLSGTEHGLPATLAGQTTFPRANVSVTPCAGTLVSWENTLQDGKRNPYSLHQVGVYRGRLPRIAFQIPVEDQQLGTSEHVGCGYLGREKMKAQRRRESLQRSSWKRIAIRYLWKRLRTHARLVGKFVCGMRAWYDEIAAAPPNGHVYLAAAKRFKLTAHAN